jgi:Tol biopolymer transport system component
MYRHLPFRNFWIVLIPGAILILMCITGSFSRAENTSGGQVSFVMTIGSSKETHIYLTDSTGENLFNLTRSYNLNAGTRYSWSPDGVSMVFTTDAQGIRRLDMDRSVIEVLSSTGSDPAWSPLENTIVYSYSGEIYRLSNINLTRHSAQDFRPFWMPDGRIVFTSDRDASEIRSYIMDPDGENVEDFEIYFQGHRYRARDEDFEIDYQAHTYQEKYNERPFFNWSFDGKHIVFIGLAVDDLDRSRMGIFIQDTDTGEERLIFENPEKYLWGYEEFQNPVLSPDGKKVAFLGNFGSLYVDTEPKKIWNLFIINSDGSGRTQLTHSSYGDNIRRVAWRPSPPSVAVKEKTEAVPAAFVLNPVYPNPFNPSTAISFTLPMRSKVELSLYGVTGQKVRELISGQLSAGRHTVNWDGRDDRGNIVSSGIYIARLGAEGRTAIRKMVMAR